MDRTAWDRLERRIQPIGGKAKTAKIPAWAWARMAALRDAEGCDGCVDRTHPSQAPGFEPAAHHVPWCRAERPAGPSTPPF